MTDKRNIEQNEVEGHSLKIRFGYQDEELQAPDPENEDPSTVDGNKRPRGEQSGADVEGHGIKLRVG